MNGHHSPVRHISFLSSQTSDMSININPPWVKSTKPVITTMDNNDEELSNTILGYRENPEFMKNKVRL